MAIVREWARTRRMVAGSWKRRRSSAVRVVFRVMSQARLEPSPGGRDTALMMRPP